MNVYAAADKMRVALNEALAELCALPVNPRIDRVITIASAALDAHTNAVTQKLFVGVCGKKAASDMRYMLGGRNMQRYGGAWHAFNCTSDPHHVRELAKEKGYRITVARAT